MAVRLKKTGDVWVLLLPRLRCISECCTCAGACYLAGSIFAFVSIGTTVLAIVESPGNYGYMTTTAFLSLSYMLKLAYYWEKRLALFINASLACGWLGMFVYSIVAYTTTTPP